MTSSMIQWIGIAIGTGLIYFLSGRGKTDKTYIMEFANTIWARNQSDANPENADRSLTYMYQNVDREINKVLGILTFDSIFLVVVQTYIDKGEMTPWSRLLDRIALTYLLLSILVSIVLLFPVWGKTSDYSNVRSEFISICKIVGIRSRFLSFAAILSLVSALAVSVAMVIRA